MSEQFKAWRMVKEAILRKETMAFEMLLDYTENFGYSSTLVYYYANT